MSEVAAGADFERIRYAQCWEDADVLVRGLDVRPGDVCLSICSAGDNTLALLTRDPARVVAIDLSAAQVACLRLRMSAYRVLEHGELLELMGSRPSTRRAELYRRCRDRGGLGAEAAAFWDGRGEEIARGIGGAGKFERYFGIFRSFILPLVHGGGMVRALLEPRNAEDRRRFYDERWDTLRWRVLFRVFFSRVVMGRLGRDPSFFRHVEGSVAERILGRARSALRELDPAVNPYIHWILTGTHGDALPLALRGEHFDAIRSRLDRVHVHHGSIESWAGASRGGRPIDRFNLSDIFEYMSEPRAAELLAALAGVSRPGGRLLYWNMLAPRSRPEAMSGVLRPLDDLARECFAEDRAFFYGRLVIEEVCSARERDR